MGKVEIKYFIEMDVSEAHILVLGSCYSLKCKIEISSFYPQVWVHSTSLTIPYLSS